MIIELVVLVSATERRAGEGGGSDTATPVVDCLTD